ncbi:MAG: geranylgeranyl reductase family protein [Promethearchaeota archaeon]
MYDVIISGAGPSGSHCAEVLAKAGYKVALIERDSNWRKPCGGGVSEEVWKLYPKLEKLNFSKNKKIVMYSSDFHTLEIELENPVMIIDRLDLDNVMRESAVDAGSELFDKNLSYDFIIKNKKKIGIKTKTSSGIKEYYGNLMVVADGMSSKLAIKSGLRSKWKVEELGIIKCAIMEGNNLLDKESIYLFFQPYKGYGWIFPIGNKRFNIGCGTFSVDNLNYNLNYIYNEFLNQPKVKEYLSGSSYRTIWSAAYPLPAEGIVVKCLYGDNLMLVGDAAGFVSPMSGEGIPSSVISGKIAAETAIESLQEEDFTANVLKRYKNNPEIKNYIRNFKSRKSARNYFYENNGENLNIMLELAEEDLDFRKQVRDLFLASSEGIPSKEFFSRIKSASPSQI